MEILIADGKKFNLWKPKDEEKEFHPLIKVNYKHILVKINRNEAIQGILNNIDLEELHRQNS